MGDLRFLIIGLGSMGKRRVRNLQALGHQHITGWDRRADRCDEARQRYGITIAADAGQALAQADAVIISLPPDLHVGWALRAVAVGKPVFCEASVTDDGLDELCARASASGVVVFPSCTMRYFPAPRAIRTAVLAGAIGKPLFFTYHSGQYLPDWHPWESLSDYYVSNPATGGCREIVPFELAWLTWLFGDVTEVTGSVARLGDLGVPIDDHYHGALRFADGTRGALTVDVLVRPAVRTMRLVGTAGTLRWDDAGLALSQGNGPWQEVPLNRGTPAAGYINPEEPYQQELGDFIACIARRAPPAYDLAADHRVLRVLYALEDSARRGARIRLGPDQPAGAVP